MQLITDTSFGAAGQMGRVDAPPCTPERTLVIWPTVSALVPPTDLRMAFPSVVHPGRPGGRRASSAPAEPRPPKIGTGFHRGSHWTRELFFTQAPSRAPGYLKLYFGEVGGEVHGPLHRRPDERVEQIQQWLEEETFQSLCVDEETNAWLARVEISTSCGVVLCQTRNLDDYPIRDGDTLTVVVLPNDPEESQEAASVRPDA